MQHPKSRQRQHREVIVVVRHRAPSVVRELGHESINALIAVGRGPNDRGAPHEGARYQLRSLDERSRHELVSLSELAAHPRERLFKLDDE